MNQKLSDLASIAEIVSGIAVVVTLVFLILGIEENTNVIRASNYADIMASFNDMSLAIADNPELNRLWLAYLSFEAGELNDEDNLRLANLVQTMFRNWESAWYASEYGVLGESEWGRVDRLLCPGWERSRAASISLEPSLTEIFFDYLTSKCDATAQ